MMMNGARVGKSLNFHFVQIYENGKSYDIKASHLGRPIKIIKLYVRSLVVLRLDKFSDD